MKKIASIIPVIVYAAMPQPAWAVQGHGGSEGLVAHLIAHVLFTGGMVYLLLRSRRSPTLGSGRAPFLAFLYLILAWNLLTFSGHCLHEWVDRGKFDLVNGHITMFRASSAIDLYFYLTRLDHLLLVPAMFFLLLALRRWRA